LNEALTPDPFEPLDEPATATLVKEALDPDAEPLDDPAETLYVNEPLETDPFDPPEPPLELLETLVKLAFDPPDLLPPLDDDLDPLETIALPPEAAALWPSLPH
jgi:hypothetical protein